MLTKKAHTLEELILYLEALEMLDMVYKIEKIPEDVNDEGDIIPNVWIVEYQPGPSLKEPAGIVFED